MSAKWMRKGLPLQASYAALQDAKKDAKADLTQVIETVEANFLPGKGASRNVAQQRLWTVTD